MLKALPYLVALMAIGVIIQGIGAIQSRSDTGGYNRCMAEIKTDEAKNLAESIKAVNEAFGKIQVLEDDLSNYEDGAASPSLERTLLSHKLRNNEKQ